MNTNISKSVWCYSPEAERLAEARKVASDASSVLRAAEGRVELAEVELASAKTARDEAAVAAGNAFDAEHEATRAWLAAEQKALEALIAKRVGKTMEEP